MKNSKESMLKDFAAVDVKSITSQFAFLTSTCSSMVDQLESHTLQVNALFKANEPKQKKAKKKRAKKKQAKNDEDDDAFLDSIVAAS